MMLAVLAALAAQAAPIKFEDAKADPSKRAAYLEQRLGRLVHHKEKNPKGVAAGWHVAADASARQRLLEEYKLDGREYAFEKELKAVLGATDSPVTRASAFYRVKARVGSGQRQGVILAGDLFGLAGEDEVLSVVDDFLATTVRVWDAGLTIDDREVDLNIAALGELADFVPIRLYALSVQLENVLKGTRKVSDEFRRELLKEYLKAHQKYMTHLAKEKKLYDDNNENSLQKEIYDSYEFIRATIHNRFSAAGWVHKAANPATHEYALEKK